MGLRTTGWGLGPVLAVSLAACGTAPQTAEVPAGSESGSAGATAVSTSAASGAPGSSASASSAAVPTFHGIPLDSGCPQGGTVTGSLAGVWQNQIPVFRPASVTLRTPPGAAVGVVDVTLSAGAANRSWVALVVEGRVARVVANARLESGRDTLSFFAAADQDYTLVLQDPDEPRSFEVDWSYRPLPDCNEPNDTVWTAIHVALGDTIEGYMAAGALGPSIPVAALQDWYWVTLPEAGTLSVGVDLEHASLAGVKIYNDTGEVLLGASKFVSQQQPPIATAKGLPAGNYAFVVEPSSALPPLVHPPQDSSQLSLGVTPYALSVSFEPGFEDSKVREQLRLDDDFVPTICTEDSDCGYRRTCVDAVCYDLLNPPASGLPCKSDAQCRFDDVCEFGLCVEQPPSCVTTDDCEEGRTCATGVCQLGVFRPCNVDTDCERGDRCTDNKCEPSPGFCSEDVHCHTDERCDTAGGCLDTLSCRCVEAEWCRKSAECGADERCVLGMCQVPAIVTCSETKPCSPGVFCDGASCGEGVIGVKCYDDRRCPDRHQYCDYTFTASCRSLCQSDEDCQYVSQEAYSTPFGLPYVCRSGVSAYGVVQTECRETCTTELECPIGESCTGVSFDVKYCEFPNVVPL